MKVLQVLPSLEVGGVERGVIDLARAMKRLGHDTVVISSGGPLVAELKRLGVPHYDLPVHRKSIFSLQLVAPMVEIIRKERIEIVHARSRVPAWIAWFAARKAGVPFVTTCHGYYSTHFLSKVMGWGKRVIVISRIIGRHMVDHFGVVPDKIRLIYRGVDIQQFPKRESQGGTLPDKAKSVFRIINIGRFSPIKGQVEFLKAVHLLRRRIPSIEVWLVGSEGKGKHKYTDLIRQTMTQLGLESCVKLLGTRRDIPELLCQSDLLVLSTLVPEAFGRVIIEAGAVGVPVIATRVGGVLDIIEDGQNGLLVPAGDVEGMAEAMAQLLRDPQRSADYAARLQEKVANQFTLSQMAEKNIEVYEEVRKSRKILVIKLGAVGDLILIVPSLRMLRARFPEAEISLLVDKKIAPIISNLPYLNEIIPIERKKFSNLFYLLKVAKKIRRDEFDVSIDFQNSKWTHLLAFASGILQRYGFQRGKLGFLLNRPDHTFDTQEAPVHHQFRILSKLGVRELDEQLELCPDPDSEKKIGRILDDFKKDSSTRLVGLVVGSSPNWPTKRWPIENFKMLAAQLIHHSGAQIVLIGSSEDMKLGEGFEAGQEKEILNLLGKTSHRDLISLFKHLAVVVTGDTAPLHVAAAMKTRIIALFGPTDPKRHMPTRDKAAVLCRSLPCEPCYSGTCRIKEKLACLTQISVQEVFEAVQRQLGAAS